MANSPKITPWYFGNTTVRSPFRLRDGLMAISSSSLQGNLRGVEQDQVFRQLLGEAGVVKLGDDETYSVGRKWRSAMNQHGFLYPPIPANTGVPQSSVGPLDTITPNGWRLIRAETVAGMQECFLRSLAAYYIPNLIDCGYSFTSVFSPLRHTLRIMLELERRTGSSLLNFLEMAVIVQFSNGSQPIDSIVAQILEHRSHRDSALSKRRFASQVIEEAVIAYGYVSTSYRDYADLNFRYLKATGLFQSQGRGILLHAEKHVLVEQLVANDHVPTDNISLISGLCEGALLPTDSKNTALIVLEDLVSKLRSKGEEFDLNTKNISQVGDINVVRHEVEDKLFALNELAYADEQVQQWEEIVMWMDLLILNRNRSLTLPSGEEIKVPPGEAPAYLEWIMWRAFLAIDSLVNLPSDCRKFKVDQDFLPVGTAPGGGPDLIFEFDDYVLVVEATLTSNSRQEAAEGEPVRRHVAQAVQTYYPKKVYGLFIANQIDNNTAETFRLGVWYPNDTQRLNLDIVPMTLAQFKEFFTSMFCSEKIDNKHLKALLHSCRRATASEGPIWKNRIMQEVAEYSASLKIIN